MAAEMAQRVMYERRASRELVIDSSVNIFTNSFHLMQMASDVTNTFSQCSTVGDKMESFR